MGLPRVSIIHTYVYVYMRFRVEGLGFKGIDCGDILLRGEPPFQKVTPV